MWSVSMCRGEPGLPRRGIRLLRRRGMHGRQWARGVQACRRKPEQGLRDGTAAGSAAADAGTPPRERRTPWRAGAGGASPGPCGSGGGRPAGRGGSGQGGQLAGGCWDPWGGAGDRPNRGGGGKEGRLPGRSGSDGPKPGSANPKEPAAMAFGGATRQFADSARGGLHKP